MRNCFNILCCPLTRSAASPSQIGDSPERGECEKLPQADSCEGLIREDGRMLYPISNGIPLLTPEEGIPL